MAKQKRVKISWKRLLIGTALLIFIVIILLKFTELQQIAFLLKKINYSWFFLATALQFAVLATMAGFYKAILKKASFWYLLKTATAMLFLDHALPSFSASGNVLLYYASRKKKIKKGLSSWLIALNIFLNFLFYFIIFMCGLFYLLISKKIIAMEWVWIPIALMIALLILMARILWTTTGARHFCVVASVLLKKWPRAKKRVLSAFLNLYKTKKIIKRKDLGIALIFIVFSYMLRIAVVGAVFLALGNWVAPGILITGYFITSFVSAVSYIRLGVYEATMAVTYSGLGIDYSLALTATLLYRFVSFWLPFLIGFLCFRNLMRNKNER